MPEKFSHMLQILTGAAPQQLNQIIALAAICLSAFAIYAVLAIARGRK